MNEDGIVCEVAWKKVTNGLNDLYLHYYYMGYNWKHILEQVIEDMNSDDLRGFGISFIKERGRVRNLGKELI